MVDLPARPTIPVSWGELLDKLTILQIKRERIRDGQAAANVLTELRCVGEAAGTVIAGQGVARLVARLKAVNEQLWTIEDAIRACEAEADFGPRFVELARSVYRTNDARAALKRELNTVLGSELVEEKSYAPQSRDSAVG